ncbi:hypothetical protein [Microlunatus flavus]|uniref:Uncharacterized protein n=1 Tax=Microlunatus flavus TaxID=1036181 RepID=A0A1H9ALE3_9ACTN|nr:hypothetical protein [Microlunatus flavus]SEP77566.1 hypothetical protein SAMN05421756_101652 [Microlunatus flavus]
MPSPAPTALISWAHDPDFGVESDQWLGEVLQLTVNLRHFGVDADVDLFHYSEPGVVWTQWGPSRIRECDFTLAIVNRAWRERFEGTNSPTRGAGAAAEANTLLGLFEKDQHDFRRRLLVVVLPGADRGDIPAQLMGQQRFVLKDLTFDAMTPLLRLLHGGEEFRMPDLGSVPDLPARRIAAMDDALGTPSRHETVAGVPDDGQLVVQEQLARNSTAGAVRQLLSEFASWPMTQVRGTRHRGDGPRSGDDFTGYLRLLVDGKTVGYLYANTGRLNPKVAESAIVDTLRDKSRARRVRSSSASHQVAIDVVDEESARQALAILRGTVAARS